MNRDKEDSRLSGVDKFSLSICVACVLLMLSVDAEFAEIIFYGFLGWFLSYALASFVVWLWKVSRGVLDSGLDYAFRKDEKPEPKKNARNKPKEDHDTNQDKTVIHVLSEKVESLQESLSTANNTIRNANSRVNELKNELKQSREYIRILEKLNREEPEPKQSEEFTDYQILGVSVGSTAQEIKANYKKLCNVYHPDKGGCTIMMQRLTTAYNNLK